MWSVPLAAADTSPAVDQERVIWFGTAQGDIYGYTAVPFGQAGLRTGGAVKSSPAIAASGVVVIAGGDGMLYGVARGGSGAIYGGSSDAHLYAIDPAGNVAWAFPTSGAAGSPAVGGDDTIYVGTADGTLHAVTPDGKAQWAYKAGGGIGGAPAVARSLVYV